MVDSTQTYRVSTALNTIPSEMRRQIVSHLAPNHEHLKPGSKRDLRNANLTHSCLREWVSEYMFRDMALVHVLPGMSCNLELFSIIRENAGLLKYVKRIVVQVSPAIRWEVGLDNPFALHLEQITQERLYKKFRVKSTRQMTEEQQLYCANYHRAMVEPFAENRRWNQLFRVANTSWAQIFQRFHNLEEITVGTCERVDQPWPTYTHTFVKQYGKLVDEDVYPRFIEDATVNLAWASAIIFREAPARIRSLRLSMANMDNFNTVATVNRLLSLSYRNMERPTFKITSLSLSLRGVAGTHGDRDWHGDTGSAGNVRFWKRMLTALDCLKDLELHNDTTTNPAIRFSDLQNSDAKGCILDWFLPGLKLSQLRTLRLCNFLLDKAKVDTTIAGHWPRLEKIILDDIKLMVRAKEIPVTGIANIDPLLLANTDHLQGRSWVEVCRAIGARHPGLRIELNRPVSNVNDTDDFPFSRPYREELQGMSGVVLDDLVADEPLEQPPYDSLRG